jgi:hypothetical protein
MRKIVRLTESDLTRIVRRVLTEEIQSKPITIEIKLLPKWSNRMEQMTGMDGRKGIATTSSARLTATDNPTTGRLIGTGPFDIVDGIWRKDFYYANYRPEIDEISVEGVRCFGTNAIKDVSDNYTHTIPIVRWVKGMKSYPPSRDENFCITISGGIYSKFDSFEVGSVDHRGFFEIVDVKGEYNQNDEEKLFERYRRRKY